MYKKKIINHKSFSLCLANDGGYFSIGGVNKTKHLEEIQYINFVRGNYYKVQLNNIIIDKSNVNVPAGYYFTIIDSGTTVTYFPVKIYNDLIKGTNEYCSKLNKCLGDNFVHKDFGSCYKLKNGVTTEQFIDSLPFFMFEFQDGVKFKWHPDSYLFNITDPDSYDPRLTYCLGFVSWNSNELLLGSTWMHNHDIIFDIENARIGLVASQCSTTSRRRYMTSVSKNKIEIEQTCDNKEYFYQCVIVSLIVFFMIIITVLLIGINKIRNGKKFLWLKLSEQSNFLVNYFRYTRWIKN